MFILKLAGKILLLPVWLILFVIGLAVKMTVQTYATFTSVEKNAYMSELTAEIESIGKKIKDYTYMDALSPFCTV